MSADGTTSREELGGLMRDLAADKSLEDIPLYFGNDENLRVVFLPTGIEVIDKTMGGGFAYGRITELIGEFSSGKTLLAHLAIKQAQARGEECVFIDVERSYDPAWARTLGVDVGKLIVARPRTGEQAWDLLESLCKREVGLAVLDSLAELIPTAEAEEPMEKMQQGAQARLIGKGIRKVVSVNERTVVVLINQLREKIGVMYGSPETLPGGKAQKFIAHQLVRVKRGSWIKEGTKDNARRIGFQLELRVEKAKGPNVWSEGSVPFYFSGFIDEIGGLVPLSIDAGIIAKSGAWYTPPGRERIFGMQKLLDAVRVDEALQAELRRQLEEIPSFE